MDMDHQDRDSAKASPTYLVAHLGNSIQYYNDCPRVLEKMLLSTSLGKVVDLDYPNRKNHVESDSCLRGGATVTSLWEEGNGMAKKWSSRPDSILPEDDGNYNIGAPTVVDLLQSQALHRFWDFVVVNDHTQSPVRSERKELSETSLRTKYLETIANGIEGSSNESGTPTTTTVVFVMTMAYKSPVKDSADLGSFDEFTEALEKGYDEYVALTEAYVRERFPDEPTDRLEATVAPLGRAYQILRNEHFDLWSESLYANDDFHPSPHGTWLEACILHCVITGQKFDLLKDNESSMDEWWKRARYMQPAKYPNGDPQEPLPLPTIAEAKLLNDIAHRIYLERLQEEKSRSRL